MTYAERKLRQLEDEYGTGVRPGWVSTEIALLKEEIRQQNLRDQSADTLPDIPEG